MEAMNPNKPKRKPMAPHPNGLRFLFEAIIAERTAKVMAWAKRMPTIIGNGDFYSGLDLCDRLSQYAKKRRGEEKGKKEILRLGSERYK
jgi:hypothetical protein